MGVELDVHEADARVSASYALMTTPELKIFQNVDVRERVSDATRRVLEQRANPEPRASRFLTDEEFAQLQELVDAILPQGTAGTSVDIADAIDRRLQSGKTAGWRYATLPADGEAYRQGLRSLFGMLQHTPMKTFIAMPPPAREAYLRCVVNGDVDGPAQFPLSTWMKTVKTEVVRTWVSHPDAMYAMEYYGFADGMTGGVEPGEGWVSIGPNSAAPFEYNDGGERGEIATAPDATAVSGSMGDGSQDDPGAGRQTEVASAGSEGGAR